MNTRSQKTAKSPVHMQRAVKIFLERLSFNSFHRAIVPRMGPAVGKRENRNSTDPSFAQPIVHSMKKRERKKQRK